MRKQTAGTISGQEDSLDESSVEGAERKTRKRRQWAGETGDKLITVTPISQQRLPHTCTTSLWANGDVGPLTYIFADGVFPHKLVEEMNTKYAGKAHIIVSGKTTHFMDGPTTLKMWQQSFTPALARRRERFKLERIEL